ncbi:hypothetical protein [Streptomyces sp. NPDC006463]|uniref:hypothetical protein n=1 Tax=Streptomyces sp. NPDC006463 TaxID=3364746 RepID=UPI0036770400
MAARETALTTLLRGLGEPERRLSSAQHVLGCGLDEPRAAFRRRREGDPELMTGLTAEGYLCWEYVVPYFGAYRESEVRELFPAEPNAVFRSYRYGPEQLPWLGAGVRP